ncbi:MAG: DUF4281 domain-containing protein [Brevundimonas sp.]|uniref:ABA4-like family protein n=1 Tax=Brevundimonas sp. TaxID=1871086 RepID=UPI001A2A2F0A|nr:ABA4-like family protein [Brevundimonas sp.]MBJ7446676.1 DUF4281 domain-containing protein [Brevundimonas sp.]
MTADRLFDIANLIALLGWIALAFAPLARDRLVLAARVIGVALALTYAGLLIGSIVGGGMSEGGGFTTLAGVTALFSRPEAVLVGWVHYLAFDLWVGAWAVEDAGKRGVPHWAMVPVLFLTLMAGPIGLLVYLAARAGLSRRQGLA